MNLLSFLRGEEKPRTVNAGPVEAENKVEISMNKIAKMPDFSKGDTAIEKRIRWLINNPPDVPFVRAEITPKFAAELLTYIPGEGEAIRQRPYSRVTGRRYAEMMRAGEWRETTVPIIFTKSGYLGDGQHRVNGVVDAQVTIPFWLAFGDPDENFFVYDTGKARTKGNIFFIKGVANANEAAAAIRWISAYENNDLTAGKSADIGTNERAYEYYLEHRGIQDSMRVYRAWKGKRLANPSVACAMHYIAAQKSRGDADEFFLKAATGLGFSSQRDPAYKLRERMTSGEREPSRKDVAVWIVHAWNAMRTRKAVGRWPTPERQFPRML